MVGFILLIMSCSALTPETKIQDIKIGRLETTLNCLINGHAFLTFSYMIQNLLRKLINKFEIYDYNFWK